MKLWSSLAASAALVLAASSVAAPALAAPNDSAAQGASTSKKTTTDSGGAGAFKVPGAIGKQWKELRGTDADLGQPRAEQECGLRADACMQQFENGTLVWTPENGRVLTIRGALHQRWTDEKAQDGDFGYPLADEECTDSGCGQVFEGGQIHYTHGKETFTVRAPIIEAYGRSGDAAGPLGRPIAEASCDLADGGCFQTFEKGSIYYTPKDTVVVRQGADRREVGRWKLGARRARVPRRRYVLPVEGRGLLPDVPERLDLLDQGPWGHQGRWAHR